jgi:3-phenylpropionate/cinnamic acid dioxygenase small subunit
MAAADGQVASERRMSANPTEIEAVRDLVQQTAALLDDEKLDAWLNLFEPNGTYELCAYSTEIRRWMTWQLSDRPTLEKMLKDVGEHVRDPARRRHIVGLPIVEFDGERGRVKSPFSLFRTSPEGQSSLYMVGCYDDRVVKRSGNWSYISHKVIVDTRMLDSFTHIPV